MSFISLEYDAKTHEGVLGSSEDCPPGAWADVRRVFEEVCLEATNVDGQTLRVPWWSILAFRGDIGYVFSRVHHTHGVEVKLSPQVKRLLEQARERAASYTALSSSGLEGADTAEICQMLPEKGFTGRPLTAEQTRNVRKLLMLLSGATFSVPGAGKTTEALAVYAIKRSADTRLVVVAPKNALSVWEDEVGICMPALKKDVVRLQGGAARIEATLTTAPLIALISYQQMARVSGLLGRYFSEHPTFLFLDESHRMKRGASGASGSCLLELSSLPVLKLLLSGTPMPNSITDLVPQFEFLYPEIRVTDETVISEFKPIFVRTTKSELGLRKPIRVYRDVAMTPPQKRLYEALADETLRSLEAALRSAREQRAFRAAGGCVMHLIEAVSNPALLSRSEISEHPLLADAMSTETPRIKEACRIARDLASQGCKTVIWSYFVGTVEGVADLLADCGAVFIDGDVDSSVDEAVTDSREGLLRRFHDDAACKVLVANPAACAEGISLHTVCHHAIYIDRTYNAAQYIQSEDRIHRLGLAPDQDTIITILRTPGTIDESVDRRLIAKIQAMGQVLDDPDLSIRPVDLSDEAMSDTLGMDREDLNDLRKLLLGE
jgi:SNF2 family DNA or RNA helicase